MSPVTLSFDVDGTSPIHATLLRFEDRVENPEPFWRAVQSTMFDVERDRFEAEGPGWAPLADSTLRQKQAAGLPADILQASGALMRSLTTDDGDNISAIAGGGQDFYFGTRDPKAGLHQDGTRNMPARPVLDVGEVERLRILKTAQAWLIAGVARG